MQTKKRTSETFIQIVTTTEAFINIDDLKRRRDELQNTVNIDIATGEKIARIQSELDKTALSDDEKAEVLNGMRFSGTGITQGMVDKLQEEIDALEALPIETAIDVNKVTFEPVAPIVEKII